MTRHNAMTECVQLTEKERYAVVDQWQCRIWMQFLKGGVTKNETTKTKIWTMRGQ